MKRTEKYNIHLRHRNRWVEHCICSRFVCLSVNVIFLFRIKRIQWFCFATRKYKKTTKRRTSLRNIAQKTKGSSTQCHHHLFFIRLIMWDIYIKAIWWQRACYYFEMDSSQIRKLNSPYTACIWISKNFGWC